MITLRAIFARTPFLSRDEALSALARALGYRRLDGNIRRILSGYLRASVRRGILENERGHLRVLCRTIADYELDFLKEQFLASLGPTWVERDAAPRRLARWLGFGRTGPAIAARVSSMINGLIRTGRLESADGAVRRI